MGEAGASEIIKLYGRRFTIDENFRDQKDWRFGMGLVHVRIRDTAIGACVGVVPLLGELGVVGCCGAFFYKMIELSIQY